MTQLIAARRYFWGAYSFSTLGRFVHGMALSWVVWTQTHSPLWLSAIALLSALPSLPLAPVAGSMADRFHRHHILLITQTIGCAIATLTAFLSYCGDLNPYNLAVLALIFGIVTSIDGPSMPFHAGRNRRNSLSSRGKTVACDECRAVDCAHAGSSHHRGFLGNLVLCYECRLLYSDDCRDGDRQNPESHDE